MINALVESFVASMKGHPALTVFLAMVLGSMALYNEQTFVKRAEVDSRFLELGDRFVGMECRIDVLVMNSYEESVAGLESEVFKLERSEEEGLAGDRDLHRLGRKQSDLAAKLRQLNRFSESRMGKCDE